MTGSLAGKRVLVTRERPGELGALLEGRGAIVVHVPLVAVVEPPDGGSALRRELARLDQYDWLVVTSAAGAERVGAAARPFSSLRLAAVGTTTARVLRELAGRPVDVVPDVQQASALAQLLIDTVGAPTQHFLLAQADRAGSAIADQLIASGHLVVTCVAYRTVLQAPDPARFIGADALVLASGSAVQSWVESVGLHAPEVVVAIGPATAAMAEKLGLKVTAVSADHSLAGLVRELERVLAPTDEQEEEQES